MASQRPFSLEATRVASGSVLATYDETFVELTLDGLQPLLICAGKTQVRARLREQRSSFRRQAIDPSFEICLLGTRCGAHDAVRTWSPNHCMRTLLAPRTWGASPMVSCELERDSKQRGASSVPRIGFAGSLQPAP